MKAKFRHFIPAILKVVLAILLVQTLRFKFTAHEDSVYIFTKLGLEPWGRILIGALELIASILLFVPRIRSLGALLAIGLMSGAALMHLTVLGIEVKNDGGLLFGMALICLGIASILLWLNKNQIVQFYKKLFNSKV